jgi:hypothetical protein
MWDSVLSHNVNTPSLQPQNYYSFQAWTQILLIRAPWRVYRSLNLDIARYFRAWPNMKNTSWRTKQVPLAPPPCAQPCEQAWLIIFITKYGSYSILHSQGHYWVTFHKANLILLILSSPNVIFWSLKVYLDAGARFVCTLLSLCTTAMLFKLACYFPAETPLFIPINIESDAWMAELLEAIQVKLQSLGRDVSRTDLRLFKVNLFFLCQTAD